MLALTRLNLLSAAPDLTRIYVPIDWALGLRCLDGKAAAALSASHWRCIKSRADLFAIDHKGHPIASDSAETIADG